MKTDLTLSAPGKMPSSQKQQRLGQPSRQRVRLSIVCTEETRRRAVLPGLLLIQGPSILPRGCWPAVRWCERGNQYGPIRD